MTTKDATADMNTRSDTNPISSIKIKARIHGKILELRMQEGSYGEQHATALILESMKMENPIRLPAAGTIARIYVQANEKVRTGQVLLELDPD